MMRKYLVIGLACLLAVTAVVSVESVSAGGDNNCWNHGENGKYEENNNNPYEGDEFPGLAEQQRAGVVWP